jgi:hypothetical protein
MQQIAKDIGKGPSAHHRIALNKLHLIRYFDPTAAA